MISPLSINFANAAVPKNAKIPINNRITNKYLVFITTENKAIIAIKVIPNASRAITLSAKVGPIMTLVSMPIIESATMMIAIITNIFIIVRSPP